MKLNHLNICTSEVRSAAKLFEQYFGFRRVNATTSEKLAVLKNEEGFLLLFSNFDKDAKPHYPEGFHFGFILDTREAVNTIYQRLNAAGIASEPPREMHGSWTFYFAAPGNLLIEVQCMKGG